MDVSVDALTPCLAALHKQTYVPMVCPKRVSRVVPRGSGRPEWQPVTHERERCGLGARRILSFGTEWMSNPVRVVEAFQRR